MTINEIQDEIIEEFNLFDDWADKYEYIIDLGKKLPIMPDAYKREQYIIKGCQSRVWVHSYVQENKLYLDADSDAIIVKGLVSMLLRVFSGQSPAAIVTANVYFIDTIGLGSHLAQTRSNGLVAMIKQIKLDASVC